MVNVWKYALKIIETEGIFYFLVKVFYVIIGQLVGFLLYPLCWVMNIKFIPISTLAIGHLAGELDCYVKEGILGLRPQYRSVLLVLRKNVANQHFLNYWRKYILIIENPVLYFLLGPLRRSVLSRYNVEKYFCGDYTGVAFPAIQKQYYGRPPVLSLTDLDRKRGWKLLHDLGMREGAWFVCVHCRENGYGYHKHKESLRNVDVDSYFLAMQEIVARGGWVVRVGDPTMKPIPKMKNVIDYAHLGVKSDWIDVFLCASCRFFLGSNSGLSNLASVFGVASGITNIAGPVSAVFPYGPQDIGIPKLIWSKKEKRYLGFKEILTSAIGNFRTDLLFAKYNIRVIDNSPEDIRDVALEVLERLEGKISYSEEDEKLQQRFKSLMNAAHFSYGAISRVGRSFLRKYEYLL